MKIMTEDFKNGLYNLTSLRTHYCEAVGCDDCPNNECVGNCGTLSNVVTPDFILALELYEEKHPIITNKDKLREILKNVFLPTHIELILSVLSKSWRDDEYGSNVFLPIESEEDLIYEKD